MQQYRIVTAGNPSDLSHEVNKYIKEGWVILGSHQVVTRHAQNKFSGAQLMATQYSVEYSQTMVKTVENQDAASLT